LAQWLFEAKKRYGLSVLNHMVTSNHIHLLVRDNGHRDVSPNSIQLIEGRTGMDLDMVRAGVVGASLRVGL
jgi:putative transposase